MSSPAANSPRPSVVTWKWVAISAAIVVFCVAVRLKWGPDSAVAKAPLAGQPAPVVATSPNAEQKPLNVAVVNEQVITRNELAREALRHYGSEVLDNLLNKHLINDECQRLGIAITSEEVAAEIDRMAIRFGVPKDQWLKLLEEERHIKPAQYAKDIIWPTLALRKLAAQRCEPTEEEVQQAYETQYGASVKGRLIVCDKEEKARYVYALAVQKPDEFPELAKQYSDDATSAATKGIVPPIRKHLGDPTVEQIAFRLQPGQISEPFQAGSQWGIFKCDTHIPATQVPLKEVHTLLKDACRDKKLRLAAGDVFAALQQRAQIENVYDNPAKTQQHPGVAAFINGRKLTVLELAEECIERHGVDILAGTINRRLIEQECARRKIEVSEADIQAEIHRAAIAMGKVKPDGSPDLEAWLMSVTKDQKLTLERYRHDMVWPSVALKKLVGEITVTDEDIKKGYEANFGERVRCRAIVLSNHRKAIEVWEMAKNRPTAEYFGDLAEQYSIESSSRALRGEVPPMHRHSAQPLIEAEAFQLRPGELSAVIAADNKYVILFCEAHIAASKVPLSEVVPSIREDVHEKKLRVAMARQFQTLQEEAQIDNFLAGTTQLPKSQQKARDALLGKEPNTLTR